MDFIKRSILLQLVVPIIFLLVLSLAFIGFYIPSVIQENAISQATNSSLQTIKNFKNVRKYYTDHVIKKILQSEDMVPTIDHKNQPNAVPLPATMIHELSDQMLHQGIQLKIYSAFPFPNRQGNILDSFQQASWDAFNQNADEPHIRTEIQNNHKVVRVAIADKMVAQACVNCHNSHPDTPKNNWQLGDVRGVLEVSVDIQDIIDQGNISSLKIVALLAVVLIASVLLMVFKFKSMNGRLKNLGDSLTKATTGDLRTRADAQGDDEISTVCSQYNDVLSSMQQMIGDITQSSSGLLSEARELHSIAESSSHNVSQQQQDTEQVASSMEQMSSAIHHVASSISNVTESITHADNEAQKGSQIVSGAIQSIDALANEVNNAITVIQQLENESTQIGSVLDVIGSIAEQTNLLALNAAIEAARAGEQGRGFAVVADEVRTLAGRTQQSTSEIQSMIEKLQSGVKSAVAVMNKSGTYTEDSVSRATSAGEVLNDITSTVTTIKDMSQLIAISADEQNTVSDKVSNNIQRISQGAETSVMTINQTAEASQKLEKMAANLQEMARQFKC